MNVVCALLGLCRKQQRLGIALAHLTLFTARRYASAVYAVVESISLSVCLSVTSQLRLSYIVLYRNSGIFKNTATSLSKFDPNSGLAGARRPSVW